MPVAHDNQFSKESTRRAIALTPAWVPRIAETLKFLVKVFISLYILNVLMDQVDTLHVGSYWSVVLCCTIMTHIGDLKVIDLKFYVYHMFVKLIS